MLNPSGEGIVPQDRKIRHFKSAEFRLRMDVLGDRLRDAGYGGRDGAICVEGKSTATPCVGEDCTTATKVRRPARVCSGNSARTLKPRRRPVAPTIMGPAPGVAATDPDVTELQQRGRCVHGEGVECRLVVCEGAGGVGQHTYCIEGKALLSYSGVMKLCFRCKRMDDVGEELAQLERIAHRMSRTQEKRGHKPLPPWKAMMLLAEEIERHGLWSTYTGNMLRLTEVQSHDSLTPVLSNDFDPRGYYGGFEFCEASLNTSASIRDRAQLIEIAELHDRSDAFLASVCTEQKPADMSLF